MNNANIDFAAMVETIGKANAIKAATDTAFSLAQRETVARLEREYADYRSDRDLLAAFVRENLANAPDSGFETVGCGNRRFYSANLALYIHGDGSLGIELTESGMRSAERRGECVSNTANEFYYHGEGFPRRWTHDAGGLVDIRKWLDTRHAYLRALAFEVNAVLRRMTEKRTQRLADVARIADGNAVRDGRRITITINA